MIDRAMWKIGLFALILSVAPSGAPFAIGAAAAQEPTIDVVLERASTYVRDVHRQLSRIAAEERYVQDWSALWMGRRKRAIQLGHRELRSQLLLVRPVDGDDWLQYRDVYEVDGTAIRDREERMSQLFRDASPSNNARMATILRESSRYNIGDIQRNVNTPLFPLQFLDAANRRRFTFTRTTDVASRPTVTDPDQAGAFRVSTEVCVVAYQEKKSDTTIRTANRRDFPSRGRFWIEPSTGRVLMSELRLENRSIKAALDVSYQSEPLLGLLVPIEMREHYEGDLTHSVIDCRATYGKFRPLQE